MSKIYTQDGVDVAEGDSFSSFAAKVCQTTYHNSPFVKVRDFSKGHFRGPRGVQFVGLPKDWYLDVAPDGSGTKTILVSEAMAHTTAARDVLAMACADITRWGGLPLLFSNVLDVATLGKSGDPTNTCFRKVMHGLVEAANEQNLVLYKGETAELGVCVGSDDPEAITKFNWAGFAIGVYSQSRLITGDALAAGQRIIALREWGFRSNGLSSVRAAFRLKFGEEWWKNPEARPSIEEAAYPSALYDRFLAGLNGWYDTDFGYRIPVHAIIHLTGGAIKSKFAEDILFPRGLSAELDGLYDPPPIMKNCAEWRGMNSRGCYETWNGGQGVLLVVDKQDVSLVVRSAQMRGIQAQECGRITQESKPTVRIDSGFHEEVIEYTA